MPTLYPLLLQPSLHVKMWGGRKLESQMGIPLSTDEPYGEAWLLHDTATITNGELAGEALGDVVRQFGHAIVGAGNDPAEGMPLLAKFLDATDWLSVQVHPNDEQAAELEGDPRGKTEAWILLDAEPTSRLVIGIKNGTTQEQMATAIRDNQLEDVLVFSDVNAGDVLFVEANTVHAIGPGNLIYEIQQSSNVTYRLYDWGRTGLDGKPRQLHIEKGVHVSNLDTLPTVTHPRGAQILIESEYFITERIMLNSNIVNRVTGGRFHALTCIQGQAEIESLTFGAGQTVLIPASLASYTLTGEATVLCSHQPIKD